MATRADTPLSGEMLVPRTIAFKPFFKICSIFDFFVLHNFNFVSCDVDRFVFDNFSTVCITYRSNLFSSDSLCSGVLLSVALGILIIR